MLPSPTFRAVNAQRLVVIADAHLAAAPSPDEEAFLAFLDQLPTLGDSLLLAGDIYDFWFTYRHLVPRRNFRVTAALTQLARHFPIMLLGGNHDRWGGTFWQEEAGIRFEPEQLRFTFADREVLAVHGDNLHETRTRDKLLNRLLRTPFYMGAFRRLHPDVGVRIGHALGHDGKQAHSAAHQAAAAARQLAWAEAALTAEPTLDVLIMGHTHVAAAREVAPNRWYLNPGPWLREHRYATLDSSGAHLAHFS